MSAPTNHGDNVVQQTELKLPNKLYFFSLYCEGNGLVKSYPFATIQKTGAAAKMRAMAQVEHDFPLERGWHSHQVALGIVPEETIILLAKEYNEKVQD